MKVLLATNNEGKVERFKKLLLHAGLNVELCTPKKLGIDVAVTEEAGATLAENAELKARAYFKKVDMPILSNDTGFYVEGEGFVVAPKRTALGEMNERTLTKEEISEKLFQFWKHIAAKHGGKVDAAWVEAFAALYPDGEMRTADSRREVVLTDQMYGKPHQEMVVRSLYYSKTTGKPSIQHTEEEEILELKPVTDALISVLSR